MRTSTVATMGLVLLSAGAMLLTLKNFQKAGQQREAAQEQRVPRYVLSGARWTRLNPQGQPEYVAQAQALEYFDDESARMTQPLVTSFGGKGSPWKLSSPTGSMPAHSRDILLDGKVDVHGNWEDGRDIRMTTPHLLIDTAAKVLRTDAEVDIHSAGRSMQAKGMIADSAGEQVKLLGKVHGVYAPES